MSMLILLSVFFAVHGVYVNWGFALIFIKVYILSQFLVLGTYLSNCSDFARALLFGWFTFSSILWRFLFLCVPCWYSCLVFYLVVVFLMYHSVLCTVLTILVWICSEYRR